MEIIEVPFDYIINKIFLSLLEFEEKRAIDKETLRKAYDCITEKIMEVYEKGEWVEDIILPTGSFDENLEKFLKDYSSYYNLKNNIVYLNDNVNYRELDRLTLSKELVIFILFKNIINIFINEELRDLFQVHKLNDLLEKYKPTEDKIEQNYLNLDLSDENKIKEVIKGLAMRNIFCHKLLDNLPEECLGAITKVSYNNSKKSLKTYEVEPLSRVLWEKCAHYLDEEELVEPIFLNFDSIIYDPFYYAIYSKESLVWAYINNCLEYNLHGYLLDRKILGKKNKINGMFDTDVIEGAQTFYISYIYNLMTYEEQYGIDKDLEITRKRLLYLLDRDELNLFMPQNLINAYNAIKREFDVDNVGYMIAVFGFMADEIFMAEPNIHIKKKLLFLRTYYDLTSSKKLSDIIDSHRNHPKYKEYSEVIYGLNRGKERILEK